MYEDATTTAGRTSAYRPPPVPAGAPALAPRQQPAAEASYRPEIDGLRAVAVLSVLFYHLGFTSFTAGYVGVDVFFVISGYLITRLITGQIERERFSIGMFYVRRIRRLLPVLLATTAASLLAGYFLFSPERLKELAASLISASFSFSNWYFFRHSDYFAAESTTRPLLHTWSLAVEEQFYLAWPTFLLLVTLRPVRRFAPIAIVAVGLLSLALTIHFRTHTAAVFYLTPFRAFELAIGALLVWADKTTSPPNWVREIALPAGLALIVLSVIGVGTTAFSGVALLTPCLGAALAIYGGVARMSGVVLRNRVMVALGLISYSLYLIHWPVIVFLQYWLLAPLTLAQRWLVVVASIHLATVMYFAVERRFRVRTTSPDRRNGRFFAGYSVSLAALVAVAAHMASHDGWLWRYPPSIQQQIRADVLAADTGFTWRAFRTVQHSFVRDGRRRVLLIGDSQGADVVNMLAATGQLARVDLSTVEVDMQCQAIISFQAAQYDALNDTDRAWCAPARTALQDTASLGQADEAILALQWDWRGIPSIAPSVARLRSWGIKQVYVVGRKSQWASGPELLRRFRLSNVLETRAAARKNPIAWDANARIASLHAPFTYVDLMSRMCPTNDLCHVLTDSGDVILFDTSHFSPDGARYFGVSLLRDRAFDF
jgi:peptidoglycan/LPS O-acetylase OafA/YrhL